LFPEIGSDILSGKRTNIDGERFAVN